MSSWIVCEMELEAQGTVDRVQRSLSSSVIIFVHVQVWTMADVIHLMKYYTLVYPSLLQSFNSLAAGR